MANKRLIKTVLARVGVLLFLVIVVAIFWYSLYHDSKEKNIVLKSRYTFAVRIDTNGNVITPADDENIDHALVSRFGDISISKIGDIWIKEFMAQYTQKYISFSRGVKNVKIEQTQTLNEDTNTVLVSFKAQPVDGETGNFPDWNAVIDNGVMKCNWVITYNIDKHDDGTATVTVASIVTPEEYGLAQYNVDKNLTLNSQSDDSDDKEGLVDYSVKNNKLSVTYDDGSHYITVPVDLSNMTMEEADVTQLKKGTYFFSSYKTAFIYGGMNDNGKKIPVTLLYSNDKGENWTTYEIDNMYNVSYLYVYFSDQSNGEIVISANNSSGGSTTVIYNTKDGGTTCNAVGISPINMQLKGVKFINDSVGFFCYKYDESIDSNLYMTTDGGNSFKVVQLASQELEGAEFLVGSTESSLKWEDVYKEATVPVCNSQGVITVYLIDCSNNKKNYDKMAAKYQSSDNGATFNYVGLQQLPAEMQN